MKKSIVNGTDELPLYTYLKSQIGFQGFPDNEMSKTLEKILPTIDPNYQNTSDIKWNFTKFVIGKDGKVVKRFEPSEDMDHLEECIKSIDCITKKMLIALI